MSDDLADRPMYGLVVALIYGTIAVAANFINKYAMMILPLPNLVLLIKTFTMLAVTQVLAWTGIITLPPLTVARLQKDMPICLIYVAHANLVLRCLMNLSVPMYNTLKRLCPVMVLVAKSVIERKLPDLGTTGSVLTSVLGCILAGLGDLEFNTQGYFLALMCAMLQASYIILAEYAGKKAAAESAAKAELEAAQVKAGKTVASGGSGNNSEGTFEIMHSVGIVGTPILMLLVLQSGEQNVAISTFERQWELLGPLTFTSWMTMISVIEGMLTGTMMWCSAVNSALTTSVVGVLKGIFAVALGFFLLGGVEFSFLNVLGMSVNIVGGVWYTVLKYRQAAAKKSSPKVEMASKELSASEKAPLLANGGDLDHGSSGYGKV